MIFTIGRNNFALTVMVPYDCGNNCAFCTAKDMYHIMGTNVDDVKFQLARTFKDFDYPIKDVVFTGGEPTTNLGLLQELIDIIPDGKNIYINTTLPSAKFDAFRHLLNEESKINGINVSRHMPTYDEDQEFFDCEIVGDEVLGLIDKPIRINCVLTDENEPEYKHIIERWESVKHDVNPNVSLCFRENFATLTLDAKILQRENLHNPYTPFLMNLGKEYLFVKHTQCNVCDSTQFMTSNGLLVIYHRGLERSSVRVPTEEGSLEINDLVIFPDGRIGYDWKDVSVKTMHECEVWFDASKGILRNLFNTNNCQPMQPIFGCSSPDTSVKSCGCWNGHGTCGPISSCG